MSVWDIFLLMMTLIIVSYSFMIGKDRTVKLLLALYITILGTDSVGSLLYMFVFQRPGLFAAATPQDLVLWTITTKIVLLFSFLVILVLHGGFEVDVPEHHSLVFEFLEHLFLGVVSAGILLAAFLTLSQGASFIAGMTLQTPLQIGDSQLAHWLIQARAVLLALPLLYFVVTGPLMKQHD